LVKTFNSLFVGIGGAWANQSYDAEAQTAGPSLSQAYRDAAVTTVSGRIGYFVGPTIYSYIETSSNQQSYYNESLFSSRGYRTVAGLGADPLSLFKGEIYGGYAEQDYDAALGGAQGGSVFGGRLSWLPTAYLTLSSSLEQNFSTSAAISPTPTKVSPTKDTSANLTIEYALAQTWSASAHLGFTNASYIGSSQTDEDWSTGLTFRRQIWKNLSATLDYQFNRVVANYSNASYTQNVVSLGVTYFP
jgi:hypothetical protein